MARIQQGHHVFTAVSVYEVTPDRQRDLLAGLSTEIDRWIGQRPGFVSASLHRSLDGSRVLLYTQWTSEPAWRRFHEDPEFRVLRDRVAKLGARAETDHRAYEVMKVTEGPELRDAAAAD
jgi:heme-degrading monooxygenase HmoA